MARHFLTQLWNKKGADIIWTSANCRSPLGEIRAEIVFETQRKGPTCIALHLPHQGQAKQQPPKLAVAIL